MGQRAECREEALRNLIWFRKARKALFLKREKRCHYPKAKPLYIENLYNLFKDQSFGQRNRSTTEIN